jgi:hypothetical protein
MPLLLAFLLSIINLAGSYDVLLAASSANKQPSIDELETLNQFENLKGGLDELEIAAARMSRTFEQRCLAAFGHTTFCRCVKDNRPFVSSFDMYITAVTKTKDELAFSKMTKEDQKLVLKLREVRDHCVAGR